METAGCRGGRAEAGGRGRAEAAGETPDGSWKPPDRKEPWSLGSRESSASARDPGKGNRKLLPSPESPNVPGDQSHLYANQNHSGQKLRPRLLNQDLRGQDPESGFN